MKTIVLSYLITSILGIVFFVVLLTLKLCNLDFEPLTWFWVFSPLWMAWVIENIVVSLFTVISFLKTSREEQ